MWVLQPCKSCGRTHLVWKQQKEMSCGIACMMMAVQRKDKLYEVKNRLHRKFPVLRNLHSQQAKPHPHPTEDEMRVASRYHRGGYRPSPKDVPGAQSSHPLAQQLINELKSLNKQWTHTGITGLGNVAATLNSLGVSARFHRPASMQAVMDALTKARWGSPIVAGIDWVEGGGSHVVFVDCATALEGKKGDPTWRVCICDPDGYLVHVDIPPKTTAKYPAGTFKRELVYL